MPSATPSFAACVVGQRQDKVFAEGVVEGKGDQVMVAAPVHRVQGHVLEHVVHPAHVPFVVKAQAAYFHRFGHQGPGRGFFRYHQGLGMLCKERLV